jgi:hypothetical protein
VGGWLSFFHENKFGLPLEFIGIWGLLRSFLVTFAFLKIQHKLPINMSSKTKITVAYGDGIGPEIMTATLNILEAAGAQLEYDVIEIGEQVYLKGVSSGMEPSAFESLRETKVFLKYFLWTLCKRKTVQVVFPIHPDPFSEDRHGDHPGE